MRAWWSKGPVPGNLGDVLTPIIMSHFGYELEWVPIAQARFLGIGSIIRFARSDMTIFGSGAMRMSDTPSPKARYLAVRGPLTRQVVLRGGGRCPEVYGDPALLLPLVHNTPVEKKYDIGLVPHYIDMDDVQVKNSSLPIINPLNANPLLVVDQIRACRSIISSSLHGIIVAHAYGIPAAWVRLGNRLNGDDTKFRDHGLSVGIELTPWTTIKDAEPSLGQVNIQPLLEALRQI